jgi:hypothetical protein
LPTVYDSHTPAYTFRLDLSAELPRRIGRRQLHGRQTAAIHFDLVPLLQDKTGIPFNLTIDWLV